MAQRIITLILLLCSTSAIAGLFDAPGRSNFVPADQAFAFDFQQNQDDLMQMDVNARNDLMQLMQQTQQFMQSVQQPQQVK